tara:strand:+ start:178 stop:726 length:549 start_codon:yes stop_codon:yes gene_type:complete
MAQDRRIIMKTSVLPTARTSYAAVPGSLEEKNITKAAYNKNVISSAGRLGGTSKMTDISSTQWSDSWSSMMAGYVYWEDLSDSTDVSGNRWEDVEEPWDGIFGLSTSGVPLADDTSDLQFCYIKNLGSNTVKISLDSDSSYPLKLSANASTMFRGYSTNLKINEVYVKTSSGTSTIEYLIAK